MCSMKGVDEATVTDDLVLTEASFEEGLITYAEIVVVNPVKSCIHFSK